MKLRSIILLLLIVRQIHGLTPGDLNQIVFEQKIGQQISPDLTFRDSDGRPFRFHDQFGRRPTLLVLGYFHCPMLCTLINNGLIQALQELPLTVGRDFDIVDLSVDARESSALAATKKIQYIKSYGRPGAEEGWHFLVGDEPAISEVARESGFHFAHDPESNQYAHPSGVVVLTSSGKISRYFLGVNIDPGELRAAIAAASRNETGSVIQRFALLCYHYNPITGKYGGAIMSILRAGSLATVLTLIAIIGIMVARDRRARRIVN